LKGEHLNRKKPPRTRLRQAAIYLKWLGNGRTEQRHQQAPQNQARDTCYGKEKKQLMSAIMSYIVIGGG